MRETRDFGYQDELDRANGYGAVIILAASIVGVGTIVVCGVPLLLELADRFLGFLLCLCLAAAG